MPYPRSKEIKLCSTKGDFVLRAHQGRYSKKMPIGYVDGWLSLTPNNLAYTVKTDTPGVSLYDSTRLDQSKYLVITQGRYMDIQLDAWAGMSFIRIFGNMMQETVFRVILERSTFLPRAEDKPCACLQARRDG